MSYELMNSIENSNKRQFHFHRVNVSPTTEQKPTAALKPAKGKLTRALGDRDLCKKHLHIF